MSDPVHHVYVLVRRDLSFADQVVQAAHAALEAARQFDQPEEHPHLVVLGVRDEAALSRAWAALGRAGVSAAPWREPDLGDSLTAVASAPLQGDVRRAFRKYQLLAPVQEASP